MNKLAQSPILVIIPARGGSKGISRKNLKTIHGKSLTEWAILSTLDLPFEKSVILSSDSDEILQIGEKFEDVIISRRPDYLSEDFVADYQVLKFELEKEEQIQSREFKCIVMIQPTSPIRNPETLKACVEQVVIHQRTSAWTISPIPVKYHSRKQLKLVDNNLQLDLETPLVVARQELPQTYVRTGVCYAISRETLLSDPLLLGRSATGIQCAWPSVNIDEIEDLINAQKITHVVENRLLPIGSWL